MKNFLKNKSVGGFWIPAASLLPSVIVAIAYTVGFQGTKYASTAVAFLPLVASALFFILSATKWTAPFAAPAAGLVQFYTLLQFVSVSYMYLTEVFYGGVTMSAIGTMNKAWPITLILLIVNIVLCNIGFYHKQERSVAA